LFAQLIQFNGTPGNARRSFFGCELVQSKTAGLMNSPAAVNTPPWIIL
jgi:hypothetical protein